VRSSSDEGIAELRERLAELEDERARLLQRIGDLEGASCTSVDATGGDHLNASSSNAEKIELFQTLFAARSDEAMVCVCDATAEPPSSARRWVLGS